MSRFRVADLALAEQPVQPEQHVLAQRLALGNRPRAGVLPREEGAARMHEQHLEIADTPISVCQDRSIYEDYEVFVKGLLEQRIFSHRDFRTYRRLFQSLTRSITPPTLLIYLNASVPTLLERINGRSRPYERTIPTEYLAQLNRRYEEWLRRFELCPVLSVETDQLDFAHDVGARREIVELISQAAGVRGMKQERMIP